MAAEDLVTDAEDLEKVAEATPRARKKIRQRKKPAKKRARGPARKRRKKAKHAIKEEAARERKPGRRRARRAEDRERAPEQTENSEDNAAAVVQTHADAVEESVPASVVREDTRDERPSLRVFDNETSIRAEVATKAAREPVASGPGAERAAGARGDDGAEALRAPDRARSRRTHSQETAAEELSPEEALAMLAEISESSRKVDAGRPKATPRRVRRPRPPGSVVMPSCKVIAFETAAVEGELRVAGSTVARLYGMIHDEGLDLELGPVCQAVDELIDEWDSTPLGQTIILLVNLIGAEDFLEEFLSEVPEVAEAYWIVFETLRCGVTTSRNKFLTGQRAEGRAKAVGFGPRNVVLAARSAAEAVRWRVQWGYGGRFAAKAG